MTLPRSGLFGAIAGRHPQLTIDVAPARRGESIASRVAEPRFEDPRARGDNDVTTVPDLAKATASAATPAAAPRIKLSPQGFCIDHPDPALGERLMADTLGVADPDAMHGILRQLVRASVKGERCDEVNLAFMIAMIKSIKPRDSVEAMLVAV